MGLSLEIPPRGTYGPEIPRPIRFLVRAMSGMGMLMFRLGVKVQGRPLLKLTTVGARTGKPRHSVLGWFPDDGRVNSWLIVASNAGSPRHPGWAHNLARNPDQVMVDVGEGPVGAIAMVLDRSERETAWSRIVEMAPRYGVYTAKTDREIPIFRLTRRNF